MADSAVIGILRVLLTANSAELEVAFKRAQESAKVWSKDLKQVSDQATQLGSSLTKTLTLPIVGLSAGVIKVASDFDSAFAGVRKTVDATEPEFAQLAQGLRDMAKEIPVSVTELTKVAEAAGQLGIKKDDIIQFTRTMAALGVTTNLTAEEAATATAQIQNIFGAAGKDVDRFGAALVALGNSGASTEKDIISMGLKIASAGNLVGLSQDQVLAFASALSSVGIEAEAGGTAISRTFLTINDAVMAGGGALNEFARVAGMSAEEFKAAFEQDAAGATVAFINGLARIKGEGENVNTVLGGLELGEIRVRNALLAAAGAGQLFNEQLAIGSRGWKDNSALTDEARERYKTFESQVTRTWNQIKDLGITIGTALLPVMRDLLTAIQPLLSGLAMFAQMFADLPAPVRMTGVVILGLLASVGPVIYIFGQLTGSAANLTRAFTTQGIATRALSIAFPMLGAAAGTAAIGVRVLQTALMGIGIGLVITALGFLIEKLRTVGKEVESVTGTPIKQLLDANGKVVMTLDEAKQKVAELGGELITGLGKPLIIAAGAMSQQTAPAAKTLTAALKDTQRAVAGLTAEQRAQLNAGIAAGMSTEDLTETFNKLKLGVTLTKEAVDLYKRQLETSKRTTTETADAVEAFRLRIAELALQQRDQATAVGEQITANQNWGVGAKTWTEWLDRINALQSRSIEDTAEMTRRSEEQARAMGAVLAPAMLGYSGALNEAKKKTDESSKSTETWRDQLSDLAQSFSQLAQVGGDSFGGLAKAIGQIINALDLGVKAGETFIDGMSTALKGGAKNLASGMASLATGLVSGIGSIMGATSTGSALQRAIGGALSGAGLGAGIGTSIGLAMGQSMSQAAAVGGVWGLAAGAIVGIFIGVFRGRDTRREMERVGEEWGVAISEGVSNRIRENASSMFQGNRQAARIFNLSAILEEAGGLDTSNLQAFTARLRDVFVMFATGAFDASQAVHVLDENWSEFARVGTDASGRLSSGLREILHLARQNGLESRAMTEYTRQQAQTAIEGFGGIVAASGQARQGYAQLADNVRAAQGEITKLRDAGVTGGAEMEAAQRKLTQALTAQQAAAAAASGELSDMGVIAVAVYASAIENGLSHAEAIEAAGPAIMDVAQAYRDLGLDVDNTAFRALSLQAELQQKNPQLVAGVNALSKSFIALSNTNTLNVDSFRAMERMGVQMYDRLMTEVTALGGTSADALLPMQDYLHEAEKQARLLGIPLDENTQRLIDQSRNLGIWRDTGEDSAETVTDAVNELVKAVRELVDEWRRVPPRVETTVTTRYRTEGQPPPEVQAPDYTAVPNFARGSGGVRDFRGGTLAMLHGREMVIPEADLMAAGPAGGVVHVTVNAQGAFFDTPESLKRLGKKVAEAIRQSGDFSRVSFGFPGAR